ncbi:MAG: amidohydrolase family protein [Chloroflexi bacterium]|nr:amidohydrolase family protein [Chloroflexota bacterium]
MNPTPLYFLWQYNDVDRAFWAEHFEDWLPRRILDAHTHVMDPRFRLVPMTEAMRRQYWVSEVFEPIDAATAERCVRTVFPNREVTCVAFGFPDLDFDLDGGNAWLQEECARRGWFNLLVIRPQWSQEKVAAELAKPGVIGVKPYYSLISPNRETRDAHLEAGIFEFLPHHLLEVINDRRAWVTLHVPKAARLGHPDNLREIRELRRRYRNVVLVIAHLGRCYTESHALEGLLPLADDPGIFFDTSAVLNPASHRVALEHIGPQRILYGTDNPILYMRGRRQYRDRTYINRTNYPFHFNREREAPEIEAGYTLYMYEDLRALKQACEELGIVDRSQIEAIFHDNAARLIQSIAAQQSSRPSVMPGA